MGEGGAGKCSSLTFSSHPFSLFPVGTPTPIAASSLPNPALLGACSIGSLEGSACSDDARCKPLFPFLQLSETLRSSSASDEDIVRAMRRCWEENQRLLCPHTAVAAHYHYSQLDSCASR